MAEPTAMSFTTDRAAQIVARHMADAVGRLEAIEALTRDVDENPDLNRNDLLAIRSIALAAVERLGEADELAEALADKLRVAAIDAQHENDRHA